MPALSTWLQDKLVPGFAALLVAMFTSAPAWPAEAVSAADYPAGYSRADELFLAGLRERGLHQLARRYCQQRLKRTDLSPVERAELTMELSRTLAELAASSPPEQREPLWKESLEVVERFAAEQPGNPRLLLVRFQAALVVLARGELARQESQFVADGQPLLEEARLQLRTAIKQLRQIADEVQGLLRISRAAGGATAGHLSADELLALDRTATFELARALRNQALCYPAGSADRTNSLLQAIKLLDPLVRSELDDSLRFRSAVDLCVCHRLAGDLAAAKDQIDVLLRQQLPPAAALRVRAEQIRIALDASRLDDALQVLSAGRVIDGQTSAELDLAWLEAYLAAWRAAATENNHPAAADYQAKIAQMLEIIQSLYSPYWKRRADLLVAGSVRAAPERVDLAMLIRAAESAFRGGRLDDALADYDRAAELAAAEGLAQRAFELRYIAAAIEHQRNRNLSAMDRYRRLALDNADNPKAPEAHLLAIHHAARIAKQQPETVERFASLLEEHIKLWPQATSADDARRRLAQLRQLERDWPAAIALLKQIRRDVPDYPAVLQTVESCYRSWAAEGKPGGRSRAELMREAALWFQQVAADVPKQPNKQPGPAEQFAVLAAARAFLDESLGDYQAARQMLTTALAAGESAPAEWTTTAKTLLVLALAGCGDTAEASRILGHLDSAHSEQLLATIEGLSRLAAGASHPLRKQLADVQLQALDKVLRSGRQPEKQQRLRIERLRAQALADAGRTEEALRAFRALLDAGSDDLQLQQSMAEALLSRGDAESLRQSLALWRTVEKKSPPGSSRWFDAQYAIATINERLGDPEQAIRLINFLERLYPQMGGPEMKAKFAELRRRCQQSTPKKQVAP